MAKRPSVKEILEAARKGGAAQPSGEPAVAAEPDAVEPESAAESVAAPEPVTVRPAPPANVPSPAALGRPLTLKEKLAAARAGGAVQPGAAQPAAASTAAPAAASTAAPAAAAEVEESAVTPTDEPKAVPAPAAPLGRPMTLAEKLAAARGGAAKPAAAATAAKPAAAKAGAAPAAKATPARTLPPLEKITDPKDLAEAARQAAAKRAKEDLAAKAAAAPPKAKPAAAKPQTVPPRPGRELAAAGGPAQSESAVGMSRRGILLGSFFMSWIAIAWTTFTASVVAMTTMTVRFMFPNVLAEPPSTIKIGLPSNYDPESVDDRFKADWGFWVVRSARYNGQDIIYVIQSVCTHLGCPPNWLASEQKFKCPCHGSGFYISGINFEGPAPRPLERFKVVVADDGQLLVDKSQKYQQELGQWVDPDSYIPT
jgi:cytochrome b6-f complex iron-sulfur subunit